MNPFSTVSIFVNTNLNKTDIVIISCLTFEVESLTICIGRFRISCGRRTGKNNYRRSVINSKGCTLNCCSANIIFDGYNGLICTIGNKFSTIFRKRIDISMPGTRTTFSKISFHYTGEIYRSTVYICSIKLNGKFGNGAIIRPGSANSKRITNYLIYRGSCDFKGWGICVDR